MACNHYRACSNWRDDGAPLETSHCHIIETYFFVNTGRSNTKDVLRHKTVSLVYSFDRIQSIVITSDGSIRSDLKLRDGLCKSTAAPLRFGRVPDM